MCFFRAGYLGVLPRVGQVEEVLEGQIIGKSDWEFRIECGP